MKNKQPIFIVLILVLLVSSFQLNVVSGHAEELTRKSLNIKKSLTAPIIDGIIDEPMWNVNEPLTVKLGQGEFKEAAFGMLWDNTYLYIAVDVEDDKLVHDGAGSWFQQANISMFFDPTSHQSAPFVDGDMQIGLVYQPNSATPEFHFGAALNNHAGKNENDILRAIRTTEKGWSAEVAVPWEMLGFDPIETKELGFEMNVTHRDEAVDAPMSAWSAYHSASFWNDTSGYGTINLEDAAVEGTLSDVLLEEDFDDTAEGTLPFGWTSHSNDGTEFAVVDGKLLLDGNASGKQARVLAPVQWDNYIVEADMTFEEVVNAKRWASLIVRAAANGDRLYNQMAVRQNGTYEFAYRTNNWAVPIDGQWGQELALGEEYTVKLRIVDNNIKEYIKQKEEESFTLLVDEQLDQNILERGKIGFQGDQSKVTFDNLKVTRVSAEHINAAFPTELEALTGGVDPTYEVQFSDGVTESVPAERVKLYSSDESIIRIVDNKIFPLSEGTATVKAVYQNAEAEQEINVLASEEGRSVLSLEHEKGYILAASGQKIDLKHVAFHASYNDLTDGTLSGDELTWTSDSEQVTISEQSLTAKQKGLYKLTATKNGISSNVHLVVKDAADDEYVLY